MLCSILKVHLCESGAHTNYSVVAIFLFSRKRSLYALYYNLFLNYGEKTSEKKYVKYIIFFSE